MNHWYKKAQEFTGVDANMNALDINRVREIKQWPIDGPQGAPSVTHEGLGLGSNDNKVTEENKNEKDLGKEVSFCGEEPGKGGCGRPVKDYGEFYSYSIKINDEDYRAYKCNYCHHKLKPFDIKYSPKINKFKNKKPRRKRVRRLSSHIIYKKPIKTAAVPGMSSPGGSSIHNPSNAPYGRTDLSEDLRVIPWDKFREDDKQKIYDSWSQKNNQKTKVVKVKVDGEIKYLRVVDNTSGGDGVSPANTYRIKGDRMEHFRYHPSQGPTNEGYGSWPHNRDVNKGWYQNEIDHNMNADLRERAIPWDEYIRDRSTHLLTLTKPS